MSNAYIKARNKVLFETLMKPTFHKDKKNSILREFDIPFSSEELESSRVAFETAWKTFKEFGTNVKGLMDLASSLTFEEIKTLLQKDPVSLVCLVLDTLSLVDPTGVADITQGVILLAQGIAEGSGEGIIFGILCIAFGLGQAALFISTGGSDTPLVLAVKQGLKFSLKHLSKEAFESIIKSLTTNAPNILKFLKNSLSGKKFYNVVASFFDKAKNFKMSLFKSIEEAIQYLTGFSSKNFVPIVTPDVKKKILEGALLVGQLKFYQAGVGGARLSAIELQNRLPRIRELYMRNVVCKLNKENTDLCNVVITNNTDLSVTSIDETDAEHYENARKNLNPLKIIKWYDQEGHKLSL